MLYIDSTNETKSKNKKKKRRNKKKSKKQTEPPTVPVKDLFAPKSFPHGVEHEYINESVNLNL